MKAGFAGVVVAWLVAFAALPACGSIESNSFDGFSEPDGVQYGTISFSNLAPLAMARLETATISGRYRDEHGEPAAIDIEVSLQGNAQDTSLGLTSLTTGSDGSFSFPIVAGTIDATFSVRCTAADGARSELAVEVRQFHPGSISIGTGYDGRRRIDIYRLFVTRDEEGACPSPAGEPVLSIATVDSTLPILVPHMPAMDPLAVVLRGAWCPEGSTSEDACLSWVSGCLDGVVTIPGSGSDVVVVLSDEAGTFGAPELRAELVLDTSSAAQGWVDAVLEPLAWMQASEPTAAAVILDGIGQLVAAEIGEAQGETFASARTDLGLDDGVSSALALHGYDSAGDLARLGEAMVVAMAIVRIEGSLDGAFWTQPEQSAILVLDRIGGSTGSVAADLVTRDLPPVTAPVLGFDHDLVTLHEHEIPLGAGEVTMGVARLVVVPSLLSAGHDPATHPLAAYLDEAVGCSIVASVISSASITSMLADAEWYELACRQVMAGQAALVEQAADGLDIAHPAVSVSGTCDYLDVNGYPFADLSCVGPIGSVAWGEEPLSGDSRLRLHVPVILD